MYIPSRLSNVQNTPTTPNKIYFIGATTAAATTTTATSPLASHYSVELTNTQQNGRQIIYKRPNYIFSSSSSPLPSLLRLDWGTSHLGHTALLVLLKLLAQVFPVVHHQLLHGQQRLIAHIGVLVRQQLHHQLLAAQVLNGAEEMKGEIKKITLILATTNNSLLLTSFRAGNDGRILRYRSWPRTTPTGP